MALALGALSVTMITINRFDWRLIAISGDRRDAVLGVARFRSDQHAKGTGHLSVSTAL
jgi:hypothetical protein